MAQSGVQNDDGTFIRDDLESITERQKDKAMEVFGPDVDLSRGSPIRQIIDANIAEHEHIWKLMEDVYYSPYYRDAHGDQLDKVLGIAQINRLPRRGATGMVRFTTTIANTDDVIIPEGTRVATEPTDNRPSIHFRVTEPTRLEAGNTSVLAPIRAVEPWESDLQVRWLGSQTNVAAGTVTRIATPMGGVDRVSNPYPTGAQSREHGYSFIEGRDRETDRELRARFEAKFGNQAFATIDGVRAGLRELDGVIDAKIEENVTMDDNTSTGGLPPKSLRATILGDEPHDVIAQKLVEKRPVGIQAYGGETGSAVTSDGVERDQGFDWATQIDVYVDVTVTHNENYPNSGNLEVENEVIRYIGGETASEAVYSGTEMGEDVIYDLVHSAAMSVDGVFRVNVEMGDHDAHLDGELGPDDITVGEFESAITDHTNINVFATEET